jgi:lysophospholipase L1-like esterase
LKRLRAANVLALGALAAACGGGGGSATGPNPMPTPGFPVSGVVYYDENGNGLLEAGELVRLPAVSVAIGGRSATSVAGGRFTVNDVPGGTQTAALQPASLPAFFTAGPAVPVGVPQSGGELAVAATLPIDGNRPNVYLAFGDSITWGEGSSDGSGYRARLRADLQAYWGRAEIINDGIPGTKSTQGEMRMGSSLARYRAAYALILYGTNDWNDPSCRPAPPCDTIDALRSMILQARDAGTQPILGTIPPVNPAYQDRNADQRNEWVSGMNALVRTLALQERVPLAEIHRDFLREPSLRELFEDFVHPNDRGFAIMSQAFFRAITQPL